MQTRPRPPTSTQACLRAVELEPAALFTKVGAGQVGLFTKVAPPKALPL